MKNVYLKRFYFLSLSLVLICASSEAKNIYISTSGSNANNGLSPATPWQTIAKLNSSFSTIQPGDSILFKSGETFTGSIMVNKSGTASSPIVIGSYGTGAKPLISGLTTLTGWTNVSGNIWQASVSTLDADVNILTINGIPQEVGRTDWMAYESASSTQLTSSKLTGTPSYVGAEIVMRKLVFVAERALITAQSGSTVTYKSNVKGIHNGNSTSLMAGTAKLGFFLQRFPGSLDKFGEWYYNASTDKMMIYSATNPSNYSIKASNVDTLLNLNKQSNITVANLSFEGAGIYAIESYGGTNVKIKDCSFDNNTKAIYVWNTNDITIDNNTVNNSFSTGILVSNNQTKRINVTNNTVTNTGQLFGMGIFNHDYSLRGIIARTDTTRASNYVNIIGNKVINSGSGAIQFQGSNVLVRRNVTDTFANQIDDMGGIYTFINNSSVNNLFYTNRVVDSNFISNAIGAPNGANGHVDVTGLYFDDQTNNIIAKNNTIWNIPGNGIQLNNPLNLTITGNTVYNCSYLIWINKKPFGDIKGTSITKNVSYQKDATQYNYGYINYNLSSPKMTVTQAFSLVDIDSNWISNLQTTGYYYFYSATGGSFTFPPKLTLSQWRNMFGNSVNSVLSPVTATPTNTKIEVNPSNKAKTISFNGQSYIDAKGTVYNNSATIPAWGSLVLISNGTAVSANTPPVAAAPANISITLPTNTVTLVGNGTDKEGAISSYSWAKIAGPSSGTIATPGAATTAVNNLVQGIYKFELTVADNSGAKGKDTVQVTVNPAANLFPRVDVGTTVAIKLPVNTVSLTGKATDQDGTISSYSWAKISGPSSGTIVTSAAATTIVKDLVQGVYKFALTVADNNGATAKDTITVTVNPADNLPPHAQGNKDTTITLPTSSMLLSGVTSSDPDGTIASYTWTKISGPSGSTFGTPNSSVTKFENLVEGSYTVDLMVTDDKGTIDHDEINIQVLAANLPPHAQGNKDTTITLPTSSMLLSGVTSSDPDGTITSYTWTKISGPSGSTFGTPNSSVTKFENLVEGSYTVDLMVTDDKGTIDHDLINIQVLRLHNAPIVNAGTDTAINAPTNKTIITATAIVDGTVSSYAWTKISGPVSGKITMADSATTLVSKLVEGVYEFQVIVTDKTGATGKDTIQVTVNGSAKHSPIVNGGSHIKGSAKNGSILNNGTIVKDTVQAIVNAPAVVNDKPIASLVKAYPNPVKDVTNLDITTIGRSVLTISVIDMSGKVVKYNAGINFDKRGTVKLDMSSLRDGYYIITVRFNNGEVISTRVIKQGGR